MSSSLSIASASLLETVSDILDTLEQLHTASIEFTVLRENGQPIGLKVHLQYLLAEQKDTCLVRIPKKNVDCQGFDMKNAEKQLRQTVRREDV